MILPLQILPASHIRRAFGEMAETATTYATRVLIDYMQRQWMENSVFRVEDWSVFRQNIHTNNDAEGLYCYFNYKKTKKKNIKLKQCYVQTLFIPGWHNRINQKASGSGLGFYRVAPILKWEAEREVLQMAVESDKSVVHDKTGRSRHYRTNIWTGSFGHPNT